MTRFRASKQSEATVPSPREDVWAALTDPELLPRLVPYLQRIEVGPDDTWTWHVVRLPVLGGSIGSTFVERMELEEPSHIRFRPHPDHPDQQTQVTGDYHLQDHADGTRVAIDIEVDADLPFPRIARPAVEAGMSTVMATMGAGFARNLLRHLKEH